MSSETVSSRKSRLQVPSGADFGVAHNIAMMSSKGRPTQYLARLTDVRQMDAQSALDQMKSLLGSRPHTVYKTAYYRKQTKNHWARDDPAFCVLQAIFLLVSVVAYSVAFKASIGTFLGFLIHSLFWNWLVSGALVCSILREVANRHLTVHQSTSHVRQSVEWLYAFDIHCNAFFPLFCVLYGVQFFLLPLILGNSFLALVVANTLYAVAFSWYWYITHLGYRSLPFLTNTEVFMFPIAAVILLFVLNLVGYPFNFGWNFARVFAQIYLRDE